MNEAVTLADPAGQSSITGAISWIEGTALGAVATVAAVIAIAALGFSMLNGRVPVRRGATVIIGCFIIFGAWPIADALVAPRSGGGSTTSPVAEIVSPLPQALPTSTSPLNDPYAGASVPVNR